MHQSSHQYGAAMGEGMKKGLLKKFGTHVVEVHLERRVTLTKKNQDLTDIDVAIRFKSPVSVSELFPGSMLQIRPDSEATTTLTSCTYLLEIKWSPVSSVDDKIRHFVKVWDKMLSNLDSYTIHRKVKSIIENEESVLVFLFNGADSLQVLELMQKAVRRFTDSGVSSNGDITLRDVTSYVRNKEFAMRRKISRLILALYLMCVSCLMLCYDIADNGDL